MELAYATEVAHARGVIERIADEVWRERSAWVLEPPFPQQTVSHRNLDDVPRAATAVGGTGPS